MLPAKSPKLMSVPLEAHGQVLILTPYPFTHVEVPPVFRLPSGSPYAACLAWSRATIQSCMNCIGDRKPSVE